MSVFHYFGLSWRSESAEHLRREFSAPIAALQPWRVVHMRGSGVSTCRNLLRGRGLGGLSPTR
jgi:hypothetical protein